MKALMVLCAVVTCSFAASLSKVEISTFQDSKKVTRALGRIVDGQPALPNQIPHQCSVLSPVVGGFNVCGGSCISATWILTAAHCTIGLTQHNVRCGTLQLQAGGVVQVATGAINHPSYNPTNLNNDISIIPLGSPLTFGPAIQSIRLPSAAQLGSTFLGVQSVVSGWGATGPDTGASPVKNFVHMQVIGNPQCAAVFGTVVVADHVVCALGWYRDTQSHCGGDSGGPLTIVEGATLTQIGVVSFAAAQGCHLGFPAGYMRTANFVNWIAGHTGIPVRPS